MTMFDTLTEYKRDPLDRQCDRLHVVAGIDFADDDPDAGFVSHEIPCEKSSRPSSAARSTNPRLASPLVLTATLDR